MFCYILYIKVQFIQLFYHISFGIKEIWEVAVGFWNYWFDIKEYISFREYWEKYGPRKRKKKYRYRIKYMKYYWDCVYKWRNHKTRFRGSQRYREWIITDYYEMCFRKRGYNNRSKYDNLYTSTFGNINEQNCCFSFLQLIGNGFEPFLYVNIFSYQNDVQYTYTEWLLNIDPIDFVIEYKNQQLYFYCQDDYELFNIKFFNKYTTHRCLILNKYSFYSKKFGHNPFSVISYSDYYIKFITNKSVVWYSEFINMTKLLLFSYSIFFKNLNNLFFELYANNQTYYLLYYIKYKYEPNWIYLNKLIILYESTYNNNNLIFNKISEIFTYKELFFFNYFIVSFSKNFNSNFNQFLNNHITDNFNKIYLNSVGLNNYFYWISFFFIQSGFNFFFLESNYYNQLYVNSLGFLLFFYNNNFQLINNLMNFNVFSNYEYEYSVYKNIYYFYKHNTVTNKIINDLYLYFLKYSKIKELPQNETDFCIYYDKYFLNDYCNFEELTQIIDIDVITTIEFIKTPWYLIKWLYFLL